MRGSAVLGLLLLSACSKAGGGGDAAPQQPAPAAAPVQAVIATQFPEAFRGRWGIGPNDCDPKQDFVAKGLMVVEATGLRFYEARVKVRRVTLETPLRAVADLSWSGEGMSWATHTPFTLSADGKALSRLDHETHVEIRYARCPA